MDSDLEDLETLFSEHFGRTPSSTPVGSQISQTNIKKYSDKSEDEAGGVLNIDRSRQFLENITTDLKPEADTSDHEDIKDGGHANDDELPDDDSDADKLRKYFNEGCGCKNDCNLKYKPRDIYEHILKMHEWKKRIKRYLLWLLLLIIFLIKKQQKEAENDKG
ncbi:hypothetical protein KUTeg_000172 [Tegillarca granosa]|uniref:C2H2-type domain-containing protein n=1 Tax=Tegillarca granosa TaxID=220873 RepID=A0ABQ9FZV3_TEGGR|nr:hypothetical protein KUTeg_000172 [Tegillarca granosa]